MTIRKIDKTQGSTRITAFADLTRADILRQVRRLASQLASESNPVPPTPSQIRDHFGLSNNAPIENIFGATSALLTEAKLAYRLYTDSDLLRHLSDFMGRSEKTPTSDDIDNDLTMPAAMHYIKRFGGVAAAIARANQNTPMPIRIPPPRRAPLPVVARRIEPAQMSVEEQPAPAPVREVVRASDDAISLNKLVEALADRKSENVLLRDLWHRDRESWEGRELPRDLTLYAHLDPSGTFVDAITVMKTSDWRNTWGRRLKEGETFHYTKDPDTGEFNTVDSDGKKATIQRLLGSGHVQAPDAESKVREKRAAEGNGIGGYVILECPIEKPFITLAELKKVAPLVTLPVTLPTDARGYAPSRVEWKDLATKPSVGRFNGVLARPGGAKRSSEPNAVLTFLVGLAALVAGMRILRAPNLSPAMPSGSLFQSPKEDWDQSGT